MGHLINPIAFRLSFFKSWEDTWFVKNVYYPEFLNGMLKVRNYLYFFLSTKRVLRSGIFLNNFFIVKYNKIYVINIYIYHIDFEKLSFECINKLYASFYSYNRSNKIRKPGNYFQLFINNVDIYFFFIFFYKIFYKNKKNKKKIYKNRKKKLFIRSNFFFLFDDFNIYYKNILGIYNKLIINKLFNKKNLDNTNNNNLNEDELLNIEYISNISLNYDKLLLKNNKLKEHDSKSERFNLKLNNRENRTSLKTNYLTVLEFVMFLLHKVKFSFRTSILNKIFKLKYVISFLNIFKYLEYELIKVKTKYNFLLYFLSLLLKSVLINVLKKHNNNKFRNKVYILIYTYLGYNFFFKQLKAVISFLNNIFFILNKIKNISYKFFFLSNKNITARWLCRYIGIKLKNNYSFYSVINPIKRELYKLCRLNKKKNYNKLYNLNKSLHNNNIKYKLKFQNFIKKFFYVYIKENFLYYINYNNYIYDLYIYFNNKNNRKNRKSKKRFFLRFNKFLKFYKYFYINIFISSYWEFNLLKKQKVLENIVYKINNFILIDLDKKLKLGLRDFAFSGFFMKNLLKYNYFKYIWIKLKNYNPRNLRNNMSIDYRSMLIGYKLAFKGRFSRKQRASNVWYMRGKMPLNTLSVKLDYYFFTIPLKNSAISIKITLYKSLFIEKFKYLLIY